MKTFIFFFLISSTIFSQSVIGKWKTIDDNSGKAKSVVEIYEEDGKVYGKVVEILTPGRENASWEGGSIFSSLSNFDDHIVTREMFNEVGPDIMNRKRID